jgi:hypothetical protein
MILKSGHRFSGKIMLHNVKEAWARLEALRAEGAAV